MKRILLLPVKIAMLPVFLVMTFFQLLSAILLVLSTKVMAIIASLLTLFAVIVLCSGNTRDGLMLLLITLLLSPCGIPFFAEQIWKGINNVRGMIFRIVIS